MSVINFELGISPTRDIPKNKTLPYSKHTRLLPSGAVPVVRSGNKITSPQ